MKAIYSDPCRSRSSNEIRTELFAWFLSIFVICPCIRAYVWCNATVHQTHTVGKTENLLSTVPFFDFASKRTSIKMSTYLLVYRFPLFNSSFVLSVVKVYLLRGVSAFLALKTEKRTEELRYARTHRDTHRAHMCIKLRKRNVGKLNAWGSFKEHHHEQH